MQIYCLSNSEIDFNRWDIQLSKCHNQLSYAATWYLDIVSPGWGALVSDDYEYIMPLPYKTKMRFKYIVQPILSQQLGIFSTHNISPDIVRKFIDSIPSFSYELNLNHFNPYPKALVFPNYILDLNTSYDAISSNFSKNTKRNIAKSLKHNLEFVDKIEVDKYLSFYFSINHRFDPSGRCIVENLVKTGVANGKMSLHGIKNVHGELIAAVCISHTDIKLTYLLPISSAEGKSSFAMFLLVNRLIQLNCLQKMEFDFEGSHLVDIARFYKGFGAKNHPYFILKRMRPSLVIGKLFKK